MQLTSEQYIAIKTLAESKLKERFYWSGGTLLSYYYLQHRLSNDLDFFTEHKFSYNYLVDWLDAFEKKSGLKKIEERKIYDRWEFLFGKKNKNLRVEFVLYNNLRKPLGKRTKLLGVVIDSLADIAANKTFALIDRNEPKDVFDIYFLIKKKGYSPKELLDMANKKFKTQFSLDLFFSEAHQALQLLGTLKPLMLEKNKQAKEEVIEQIIVYFRSSSNQYLQKMLNN